MTQKVCQKSTVKRKNSEILSKLRNSESAGGSDPAPSAPNVPWPRAPGGRPLSKPPVGLDYLGILNYLILLRLSQFTQIV